MLQSMTGFVSKTIFFEPTDSNQVVNITINLKSLNSKFFEVNCKLPNALNVIETDLIKMLKNKLIRGQIYLNIYISDQDALKGKIELCNQVVSSYMSAIEALKEKFRFQGDVSIDTVVSLPNVFVQKELEIEKRFYELIIATIKEMTDTLISTRKDEGAILHKDIESRIKSAEKKINSISKVFERVFEEEENFVNHQIDLMKGVSEEFAELQRYTLIASLDKMDINEEIVRFKSHIQNFLKLLDSDLTEKGKSLDFTVQEMSREINTITSKASNSQISELAISIKVELEKIREQIQNIV